MVYFLFIFICLLFVIFFTSSEIALISANPLRIRHLAKLGNMRAKQIVGFFSHPEDYLSTILVGTNFFVVATTVVVTRALSVYWGLAGKILTTFLTSFVILFFGEIIPKSLSRLHSNKVAMFNSPFLEFFHRIFLPFSWSVRAISRLFLFRTIAEREEQFKGGINRETLSWALNKTKISGKIKKIDEEIITKIFKLSERSVSDVMVPRVEMKMINYPFEVKEVLQVAKSTGLSRFPVYRKEPDRIIGILSLKDIFTGGTRPTRKMLRPAKFVPPNMKCDELLPELRDEATHMAIVVNEFGEPEGLVTLEDLIEELLGEIVDEFDLRITEETIKKIDSKRYIISGLSRVEEVNDELHLCIPPGDYDTISGFIMEHLKGLPTEDTIIEQEGFRLTVKEMDNQKIKKVLVEVKKDRGKREEGN